MWLSKDERRLLAGYYRSIKAPNTPVALRHISRLLGRGSRTICRYGEDGRDVPAADVSVGGVRHAARESPRAERANRLLNMRELLSVRPHETASDVVVIELTMAGYDLGRRYASWWHSSGLWFEEFRNHWVWLIVSTLGGGMVAGLLDRLF